MVPAEKRSPEITVSPSLASIGPASVQLTVECLGRNADVLRDAAPTAAHRQRAVVQGQPAIQSFSDCSPCQKLQPRTRFLDLPGEVSRQLAQQVGLLVQGLAHSRNLS